MNIISKLFCNDVGIDLGSANVRVWVKGAGLVLDEPSVVAGQADSRQASTLRHCFARAKEVSGFKFRKPRTLIAVPSVITEEEKQALEGAALSAGAREVFLVEKSLAAAIGAEMPVSKPVGCMVVDVGGGTCEAAVISLSAIVHRCYARDLGGKEMDNAIAADKVVETVKMTLDQCEPELAADLVDNGIVLTGGGALLRGLDKRIAEVTGLPVRVADDPARTTIRGLSVVLDELDFLAKVKKR